MNVLRTQGTRIVDSTGMPVTLRGVSLGGWLNWEGWIFGGGYVGETAIVTKLGTLVGTPAAASFHDSVRNTMIQEADLAYIASIGLNVVRVPFSYKILEDPANPGVYLAQGWAWLDNVVAWCGNHGVYAVLDMHTAPGGQASGFIYDDPTGTLLWGSAAHQTDCINMWQAIAARYANVPAVAGYDLLNEPWASGTFGVTGSNDAALGTMYSRIAAAIRTVDTNHILFLEGREDSRYFGAWATGTPIDANMVLTPHIYSWSRNITSAGPTAGQADLNAYTQQAQALGVPLWVGEMGENSPSQVAKQVAMFEGEPTHAGWAYWTYKVNALGVVNIPLSANWQTLITWLCSSTAPAPTVPQATQGMQDFLNALPASTLNPAMVTALTTGWQAGSSRPTTVTGQLGTVLSQPGAMQLATLASPMPGTTITDVSLTSDAVSVAGAPGPVGPPIIIMGWATFDTSLTADVAGRPPVDVRAAFDTSSLAATESTAARSMVRAAGDTSRLADVAHRAATGTAQTTTDTSATSDAATRKPAAARPTTDRSVTVDAASGSQMARAGRSVTDTTTSGTSDTRAVAGTRSTHDTSASGDTAGSQKAGAYSAVDPTATADSAQRSAGSQQRTTADITAQLEALGHGPASSRITSDTSNQADASSQHSSQARSVSDASASSDTYGGLKGQGRGTADQTLASAVNTRAGTTVRYSADTTMLAAASSRLAGQPRAGSNTTLIADAAQQAAFAPARAAVDETLNANTTSRAADRYAAQAYDQTLTASLAYGRGRVLADTTLTANATAYLIVARRPIVRLGITHPAETAGISTPPPQ